MWHKPAQLNALANILFGMSFGALIYMLFVAFKQSGLFPLRTVNIDGDLRYLKRDQVQLVVDKTMSGGFFTVNLPLIHHTFEQLAWVKEVRVRRRWPDKVDVNITEHKPLAKWGTSGIVSDQGVLFYGAISEALPVFIGPDNRAKEVAQAYEKYSQMLKKANLAIKQLQLTKRNAWQMVTNNGITIELGRTNMDVRMGKFIRAYNKHLVKLNRKIAYVDLRYPNGFAIRKPKVETVVVAQ